MAMVPPVEAPMTATRSVVWIIERLAAFASTTSALSLRSGCRGRAARRRGLTQAAAFTASQMVMRDSSRKIFTPSFGLVMMLTAPHSMARMAVAQPSSVEAGAHHHRNGMLRHDLLKEGQAVHARHFDVQGDDVRDLGLPSFRRRYRDRRQPP